MKYYLISFLELWLCVLIIVIFINTFYVMEPRGPEWMKTVESFCGLSYQYIK